MERLDRRAVSQGPARPGTTRERKPREEREREGSAEESIPRKCANAAALYPRQANPSSNAMAPPKPLPHTLASPRPVGTRRECSSPHARQGRANLCNTEYLPRASSPPGRNASDNHWLPRARTESLASQARGRNDSRHKTTPRWRAAPSGTGSFGPGRSGGACFLIVRKTPLRQRFFPNEKCCETHGAPFARLPLENSADVCDGATVGALAFPLWKQFPANLLAWRG